MATTEGAFLEQPYCSREPLKDAKGVTAAEFILLLPSHPTHQGWLLSQTGPASPPTTTGGSECPHWPNQGLFSKSASNLCTPCYPWLGGLSHSLYPDLYRHSKTSQCSALKQHPLHRSAAVHSKGQQILPEIFSHRKLLRNFVLAELPQAKAGQGRVKVGHHQPDQILGWGDNVLEGATGED